MITKSGNAVWHCSSESIVYIQNSITPLNCQRIKEYVTLSEDCEASRAMIMAGGGGLENAILSSFRRVSYLPRTQPSPRQKAHSKYINLIRLERASQKQSSDTHKTPYDRVKRCQERKINIKASERVNREGVQFHGRPGTLLITLRLVSPSPCHPSSPPLFSTFHVPRANANFQCFAQQFVIPAPSTQELLGRISRRRDSRIKACPPVPLCNLDRRHTDELSFLHNIERFGLLLTTTSREPMRVKRGEDGVAPGMQGRGKTGEPRENPPGVARPGTEPCSPWWVSTTLTNQVLGADEGETRWIWVYHRNACAEGTGGPRENPPTGSIARHDSHVRKLWNDPLGIETRLDLVGVRPRELQPFAWNILSTTVTSREPTRHQTPPEVGTAIRLPTRHKATRNRAASSNFTRQEPHTVWDGRESRVRHFAQPLQKANFKAIRREYSAHMPSWLTNVTPPHTFSFHVSAIPSHFRYPIRSEDDFAPSIFLLPEDDAMEARRTRSLSSRHCARKTSRDGVRRPPTRVLSSAYGVMNKMLEHTSSQYSYVVNQLECSPPHPLAHQELIISPPNYPYTYHNSSQLTLISGLLGHTVATNLHTTLPIQSWVAMVGRLDCSPSHQCAGLRVFSGSPESPALAFRHCSILTSFHSHQLSRSHC
ncbi:hypothetical protein PR048_030342 [Dryococelus australis]|uniref:Uncharacterized protein n=1 Tax=Dryococelus australis TaxID=614101 RepID=A0ABQ9GCK8_9NEOP|nr:hypothetical protein PR048_030342 [Dryococelus australis]